MDNIIISENKTVAIHQPNFLPWLGYFYKIANCNQFVILDNVDFQQGNLTSLTNRTKIKCSGQAHYFTISVKKGDSKLIKDICVDKFATRIDKQIRTIQLNYAKSPFFKEMFPLFNQVLLESMKFDLMNDLNEYLIKFICNILEIKTPIIRASELKIQTSDRNERIIEICKALSSKIYFSGNGGRKYHDEGLFNRNGIEIKYTDFIQGEYKQVGNNFIPGLSIIDVLFNCGISKIQNKLHEKFSKLL